MKNLFVIIGLFFTHTTKIHANTNPSHFSEGFDFMSLVPLIFIFGIMYFLLIRPQQKKAKEHKNMLNSISKGDYIITSGGIIGKVYQNNNENEISLEISEGIRVRIIRSMIAQKITNNKHQ